MADDRPAHDYGKRPELTWLPVDRLDVDPAYQRSLDTPGGKRLVQSCYWVVRWDDGEVVMTGVASDFVEAQREAEAVFGCG